MMCVLCDSFALLYSIAQILQYEKPFLPFHPPNCYSVFSAVSALVCSTLIALFIAKRIPLQSFHTSTIEKTSQHRAENKYAHYLNYFKDAASLWDAPEYRHSLNAPEKHEHKSAS